MANDTLDERLREAFGRSLGQSRLELDPDPIAAVGLRVARRRRRRRVIAGGAITALAIAVTSALAVSRDSDRELDVVAPPSTEPAGPESIVRDPGGVDRLPRPPLEVRGDAAVVWTGTELVVWGGDVEAFNMGLPGGDRSYHDGARFDPATGRWRQLAPSPLPANTDTPVGAMTRAGVVFTRGRSTALWDPEDDAWRELQDAPAPVNDLVSDGALVMSYSANAALDTETGRWRELSAPPVRLDRPTTAWTGRDLIVIGGSLSAFGSAAAIAYEPGTDEWRQLASPPADLGTEALSADWDGERVVVVNYDMTATAYDPATDSWAELPPVPARFFEWYPTLRSSAGASVAFMAQAIVVLTKDDRWVPLPYGRIPFGSVATTRPGFRLESGDGTLFVWGLDADSKTNTLTAVDINRLAERSRRLQIGIGSIDLGEGASLVDATYTTSGTEEDVRAVIQQDDDSSCTVSSAYGDGAAIEQPVEETLPNDRQPRQWHRDARRQIWETAATTTDVFTISCDRADTAEALARSASFAIE